MVSTISIISTVSINKQNQPISTVFLGNPTCCSLPLKLSHSTPTLNVHWPHNVVLQILTVCCQCIIGLAAIGLTLLYPNSHSTFEDIFSSCYKRQKLCLKCIHLLLTAMYNCRDCRIIHLQMASSGPLFCHLRTSFSWWGFVTEIITKYKCDAY